MSHLNFLVRLDSVSLNRYSKLCSSSPTRNVIPRNQNNYTFKNKNKLDQYILIQQHLHLDQITKRRFCRHRKTPFSTANTTTKFLLTSFTSPLILFSVSSRSFACSRCKASKRFCKSIPRNVRNSTSIK